MTKEFIEPMGFNQKLFAVFQRLDQGIVEMPNAAELELLKCLVEEKLYQTIRAKGLCYNVEFEYIQYRHHTLVKVVTVFDANSYRDGVTQMIDHLAADFNQEFFDSTKTFLLNNLPIHKDTSIDIARHYVDQASVFKEPPMLLNKLTETVKTLGLVEMNAFKNKLFGRNAMATLRTQRKK
jgi:predicted Zn-dependent peptidase